MRNFLVATAASLVAMSLASCSSGNHSRPMFAAREQAENACLRDLKVHLDSEIRKSSGGGSWDSYTPIKTRLDEYAIFDYDCKPVFAKGSTTGELWPYYFYLSPDSDIQGGVIQLRIVSELRPKDNPYERWYSFPLNKVADFDSLPPSSPVTPFRLPYSSIVADAVSEGIAFGAVMRTCRDLYLHKKITLQEAEAEIRESKKFLENYNATAGLVPLSAKGAEMSLKVIDARWEKCKSDGSSGFTPLP